jgi:hypothetical protein
MKALRVIPGGARGGAFGLEADLLYTRFRFNDVLIEFARASNGYRFGKPRFGPRYELPGLLVQRH